MADDLNDVNVSAIRPSRAPWLLVLLCVGAIVGGYWYGSKLLDEARAGEKDAKARADEAKKAVGVAESDKAELQKRLDALESEKADLQAMKEDLARDLKAKDEELSRLKGTYDKLNEKMKSEIKKGEIQLSQVGGKLRVDLIDKVLFDSGEATISKKGEEVLSRVGQILASVDDKAIQVSGHTDDSPISEKLKATYPTNWELSVARASNVVRYLQEKCTVNPKRLVAAGYGQYDPIATNANPSGRARNRRIEILLTPLLEAKATQITSKAKPGAKKHQ
jgi:chemotaxis protein MotB